MNFTVDKAKAIEALVYVASRLGEVTRFNAAKILYFADREHLRTFGRPVTGDYYVAMDNGPVPSFVYDVLKFTVAPETREIVEVALEQVAGSVLPKVRARRDPNMDVFSSSDLQALDHAIAHVGNRSFGSVSDETHKHLGWRKASPNGKIEFADLMDGVDPAVIEDAEISSAYALL